MANITVRSDVEAKRATVMPTSAVGWEPFRMMRNFLRWDPFQEMAPLISRGEEGVFVPEFEVKETKDAYIFRGDVPGVKASDLDVNIAGNRLTISGKRDEDKEEKVDMYYACERGYGPFSRAFTLPEGVDTSALSADLRDGVLMVSLPKKADMQPKRIPIKTTTAKPH